MKNTTAIDLIANLETKLKNQGIDTEVTIKQNGTILEFIDMTNSRTIAVTKGENLEDAYANAFVALAGGIRHMKNYQSNEMNRLSVM